ncbi:MAG: NAD(P)-dependent oxidoreductase [Trueperaceae bacterium]|jgi:3-hydroxyisobutyrate dehydrogenase|nr:NAD(P)-dependent oxidoreductase [Truepera sp.]HRN17704.1 NAD(P)-dependent oxidoreductase [Trueperaceae bacterium]HRQ10225.1 NAD(P)-dependent oxidoreductase [Trueperaceae bacterium]
MRIGFIGLGTMGAPMAGRLLAAGFEVTVHNRTREREEPLAALGAARAASPLACAEGQDAVFTMVSDTPDVQAIVLGDQGAALGMKPGGILVDMSTISPATTRRIAAALADHDVTMLDAPVSGGSEGAKSGTLSIMVGGDSVALARMRPVLQHLGKTITHVGPVGSGQVAKAVNQVVIAGTYAAVAEGMTLAMAAGIDVDAALTALEGGAAGSWVLANRARNMIEDQYPLGFRTRLHRKDLGIALNAARELGVSMPVSAYVEQLETSLVSRGLGDEDVSNIARVVREQAGLKGRND